MTAAGMLERPANGFVHEALLYHGPDDAVARLAAFIRDGCERAEATMVALERSRWMAVRDVLGPMGDEVTYVDMERVGRNPGRIISVWHDFLMAHPGRPVRGVGEPVWEQRSPDELVECASHERLLNLACEDSLLWLVCPYDAAALSSEALTVAHDTHPHILADGQRQQSSSFAPSWDDVFAAPLAEPAAVAVDMALRDGLTEIRRVARTEATAAGIPRERAEDLVLAVSEVAANSLRYESTPAQFRAWRDNGALVTEIRDGGRITDPLTGRTLPDADADSGRGLFIAHQLCDLVQVRSGDRGTIVRLHMQVPAG